MDIDRTSTRLPPGQIRAYEEAQYQVGSRPDFVLRVGAPSAELRDLYASHGQACAAYLTACNPYGRLTGDAENLRRQSALAEDLARLGLPVLPGRGVDPEGKWPGEPSFLVLGLTLEAGRDLARKYEQNAYLWCGEEAKPELILMC